VPPNVVIYISHDTGQHISPYGIASVHTPNAERVAAEGALFLNSFCSAPQCSPSRAGLFTGRYPHATGVLGLTDPLYGWRLHDDEVHMAAHLGSLGYETALFGLAHENMGGETETHRLEPLGFDFKRPAMAYPSRLAARDLADWLDGRAEPTRPFFAQIGVFETHRWRAGGYIGFDGCQPDESLGVTIPPYLNDGRGTHADFAALQGSVRRWDEGLGGVLRLVDERGLADDTLLVVTSDHGLAVPRAKCTLYDPGLRVMFMIRYPRAVPAGSRFKQLISNVDLLPTLLDAAGAEMPQRLHGQSVWPLLTGQASTARDRVFAERTYHCSYDPSRCVRTERLKYIRNFEPVVPEHWPAEITGLPIHLENLDRLSTVPWRPQEELYDLDSDPLEARNLVREPGYEEMRVSLAEMLWAWMQETDDPLLTGPVPSPAFWERTNPRAF
jgi:N-sulfoglucosamine sulfohydrolase